MSPGQAPQPHILRLVGDLTDDEADELYRSLRREFDDAGLDSGFVEGEVPPGAKSAAAVIAGIALPVATTLSSLLAQTLQAWLTRKRPMCTLQFETATGARIEVPSVRLDRIDEVVDQWRQATGAPDP